MKSKELALAVAVVREIVSRGYFSEDVSWALTELADYVGEEVSSHE